MRTETVMSEDGASVVRSTGSRYGPATPLASIMDALDRDEPFAFVGKPCDVGALRLLAREDSRVARRCKAMLALVCGGAPEFRKTGDLLEELGLREDEISLLRYRGYGNPDAPGSKPATAAHSKRPTSRCGKKKASGAYRTAARSVRMQLVKWRTSPPRTTGRAALHRVRTPGSIP